MTSMSFGFVTLGTAMPAEDEQPRHIIIIRGESPTCAGTSDVREFVKMGFFEQLLASFKTQETATGYCIELTTNLCVSQGGGETPVSLPITGWVQELEPYPIIP